MAEILNTVKYDVLAAKWLATYYDTESQSEFDIELDTSIYDKLGELFAVTNSSDFSWQEGINPGETQYKIKRVINPQ